MVLYIKMCLKSVFIPLLLLKNTLLFLFYRVIGLAFSMFPPVEQIIKLASPYTNIEILTQIFIQIFKCFI